MSTIPANGFFIISRGYEDSIPGVFRAITSFDLDEVLEAWFTLHPNQRRLNEINSDAFLDWAKTAGLIEQMPSWDLHVPHDWGRRHDFTIEPVENSSLELDDWGIDDLARHDAQTEADILELERRAAERKREDERRREAGDPMMQDISGMIFNISPVATPFIPATKGKQP